MTTAQSNRYTALQNAGINKSVKIVSVADIRTSQSNDTISFRLPGRTDTLWVEASLISDDSLRGFTWSGKILNKLGYLSLWYKNGMTAGFVQVENDFYELMPLNATYQFLVERDNAEVKGCAGPSDLTSPPDSSGPNKCLFPANYNTYNTCPALVSVLFVITPEAKDWILDNGFGSIDAYLQTGQATVNQAFYNSDIPNKEIRIDWIEKPEINNDVLSNPANIDLDRVDLPDLLQNDRAAYKADVAILLTNRGYDNAAGAVTAIGPSSSNAFAIIEAPYLVADYVVAHEIGHLFGCRHNWPIDLGDDQKTVCAHGKRFVVTPSPLEYYEYYTQQESWTTIVTTHTALNQYFVFEDEFGEWYVEFLEDYRILHYSNPDVGYGPEPTGRAEGYVANNAGYIRNDACTVADFFSTRELSAFITYALASPCLTTKTFTANIAQPGNGIPGQPPYTVRWYWNTTGLFNSSAHYLGQGASITLSSYPACPVFWLKCIVASSDGVRVSRIQKISIGSQQCCEEPEEEKAVSVNTSPTDGIGLFPNPVIAGIINLWLGDSKDQEMHYVISDVSGLMLSEGKARTDSEGTLQIAADTFGPGTYFLQLQSFSGETKNFKFIIVQN